MRRCMGMSMTRHETWALPGDLSQSLAVLLQRSAGVEGVEQR